MMFNYYRSLNKPYPVNADGFFDDNFKDEWLRNLTYSHFRFYEDAPKAAWLRETPHLKPDEKVIALKGFVTSMLHTDWQNLDVYSEHLSDYFCKNPHDALTIWNLLHSVDNVDNYPKLSAARVSLFAAYSFCLKEVLSIPNIDVDTCVAALVNNPLLGSKEFYSKRSSDLEAIEALYDFDSFCEDLLHLRTLLKEPSSLDAFFYRIVSSHPHDTGIALLLDQPWCNAQLLYAEIHTFTKGNTIEIIDIIDRTLTLNDTGHHNYTQLRTHALKHWWEQHQRFHSDDIGKPEIHNVLNLFKLIATPSVEFLGEATHSLLTQFSAYLSTERLTEAISLFQPYWTTAQTSELFEKWAPRINSTKLEQFSPSQMVALLNAFTTLDTKWAAHVLDSVQRPVRKDLVVWSSLNVETQRWYATHFPIEYQGAYTETPPSEHILMDPFLGPWCMEHLPLCSSPEFFDKKVHAWVQSRYSGFDLYSKEMMAVQTLLRPKNIDLAQRLHDVQKQYPGEHYKGLILEALAPGVGLGRWKALTCLETTDKDGSYTPSFFHRPLIAQSISEIANMAFTSNTSSHVLDSFELTLT